MKKCRAENLSSFSRIFFLFCLMSCAQTMYGQGSDHYGSGVVVKLNDNGSKFFRFITWHQVWVRYLEQNPGSFIHNAATETSWDIGLRRSRALILGKLSDDALIVAHFGINNQTNSTGGVGSPGRTNDNPNEDGKKPQLFLHDAYVEYKITGGKKVTDDGLFLGFGLHYYNGLSRLSMASTLNFMAVDAPIFNWTTIEAGDQFARMLGVYAKGKALGFDYTFSADMPFRYGPGSAFTSIAIDSASIKRTARSTVSNYSANAVTAMLKGYAAYEFWEKENRTLPFTVGSYVGTKKVFNIGAGFQFQPDGVWTNTATVDNSGKVIQRDTVNHAIANWAVDAFIEYPLSEEKDPASITGYAALYNLNFGDNYIRNIGIMNPATKVTAGKSFNGAGNAFPLIGTGAIFYTEIGYVFPGTLTLIPEGAFSHIRVQPYVAFTRADFEALNKEYFLKEAGINLYLDGHNAKLTFHYKDRPLYDVSRNYIEHKSEFITQAAIYF